MVSKNSHKRTNTADAANTFVRNLLCDISKEFGVFTEKDWKRTLKFFDHRCAYTDEKLFKKKREIDHLVGNNRKHCGLHLFGNIIPASKKANGAKSDQNYEVFMRKNTSVLGELDNETREIRIAKIKKFQEESGYFEKLRIIENTINLKEWINSQYDHIVNKSKENRDELMELLKTQNLENISVMKKIIKKDLNSKIEMWASKPNINVHKIIALLKQNQNISKNNLVRLTEQMGISHNSYGAIASLMSDGGNNYGKVLQEDGDRIIFCPEIIKAINSHEWIMPTT